jgi:diaminohydroxyphosphoribosylaminopyrimidine deaminase/5-amino-6-(5-phosphoribosylamino)uracil reductase
LLRVVADSTGRLPLSAALLNDGHARQTIVATTDRCPSRRQARYAEKGARVVKVPAAGGRVSVRHLFKRLGTLELTHVLCEGGSELAESLIRAGVVDEFQFFVAPAILGGREAVPSVSGRGWLLAKAPRLEFRSCERVGEDVLLRAVPRK